MTRVKWYVLVPLWLVVYVLTRTLLLMLGATDEWITLHNVGVTAALALVAVSTIHLAAPALQPALRRAGRD